MAQLLRKTSSALLLTLLVASGVALPVTSEAASNAAAKVQFVVGGVTATSTDGKKRQLKKGDRLFAGDTIQSGDDGAAQIIYRDRSRMAVRVNTTFKIEKYEFDSKNTSKGSSVFSLLSGALRAVTGLIGQANKENVTINTPLATIGIRGTDHEVVHIVQQRGRSIAKAGTYNKVYLGGTELRTRAGKINIDLRQTGFIEGAPGKVGKPVKIPDLPQAIKTQIIDKVPMQARINPAPATKEAATTTGKAQSDTSRAGTISTQPATKAGLQELAPELGTAKGNALIPSTQSGATIGREGLSVPATTLENTFSKDLNAPALAVDPAVKGINPQSLGGTVGKSPAADQMMKVIEPAVGIQPALKAPAVMPSVPVVPAAPKAVIPSVPVLPSVPKASIPVAVPTAPKATVPTVPIQSLPKGGISLPGGVIQK